MKVGMNMLLWTHRVTERHYPIIEKLKETGFDGIELEVMEGSVDDYGRIGAFLRDLGLEGTAVTVMPDEDRDPLSADRKRRDAALAHLAWAVDCCVAMGSTLLCGPFHQPLGRFTGSGPTEDEKSRAAEVHRAAAEYAGSRGVFLAVEPLNRFECYFLNTIEDAYAHVRRVDHPAFGLQFDTFHANIEEKDLVRTIEDYGRHFRHVHVSENDRGTPGRGHIPWEAVFAALKRVGYDGWVTIEAFGHSIPELAKTVCVWRNLSASERDVYEEGCRLIRRLM